MLSLFKRRRFPAEIILLCMRWYCKYGISYRGLYERMQERVSTNPSTILRWVQRYAPGSKRGCVNPEGRGQALGKWMKLMCGSADAGSISSVPSTRTVSSSTSCCWIGETLERLIGSCAKPSS